MGISGLYDFITACVSKNKSISAIRGQVVAIDMPCWVHRGAVQDAQNVVMYPERQSEKINAFCFKRLELLKKHNITPICVFDGEKLPSKKATNDQRRARREENRERAITALKNGESAWNYFIQAIRISPAITQGVKNMCKEKGYMVITAPYEADAQLAWLSREKRVDAVITGIVLDLQNFGLNWPVYKKTEDSDLFIFGTNRLITKLQDDGKCQIVDLSRIDSVKELEKFDDKLRWFRYACIMQGCDYFPKGIPGFGLKTSVKLLLRAFEQNDHSLRAIMEKKNSYFNSKQLAKWEENTAEKIVQAEDTFYYQLIVDTQNKAVKPFQPYPKGKTDADYPQCGSIKTIEDVRKSLKEKDMNIAEATGGKAEVKMEAKDDPMIIKSPLKSLKRKSYDDAGLRKKEFKPDTSWRLNLTNAIGKESLLPVSKGCLKPMKSVVPGRKLEQGEMTMRSKYFRESSIGSVSDTQSSSRSTTPPDPQKADFADLFEGDEDFLSESAKTPKTKKEEKPKPELTKFDKLFLSKEESEPVKKEPAKENQKAAAFADLFDGEEDFLSESCSTAKTNKEESSDEVQFLSQTSPKKNKFTKQKSPKKLTPGRKSLSQKRKSIPAASGQAKISSFFAKK